MILKEKPGNLLYICYACMPQIYVHMFCLLLCGLPLKPVPPIKYQVNDSMSNVQVEKSYQRDAN